MTTQVENIRHQKDEFTALTNIYLQQFHVTKETLPYKFTVLCKPYKGNQYDYQLNLMFEYSKNYPKTPLKYEIEPLAGITRDNLNEVIKKIQGIIDQGRDKPVVYDIVEEVRQWIHQYLVDGKAYEDEEEAITAKKQEVYERVKFSAFTPVTIESFNAWKKEFEAETKVVVEVKKDKEEPKMSGKEWFMGKREADLIEEDEDQDEDDEEDDEEEQEEYVVQDKKWEPKNDLFEEDEEDK